MDKEYKIKGNILRTDEKPYEGLEVKVYDENEVFLASALTDRDGRVDISCGIQPKYIKAIYNGTILHKVDLGTNTGYDIDIGKFGPLCVIPPDEWHITGIVKDKPSGDLLQGLRVSAWDLDTGTTGTYDEALGEGVTDAAGEFNIWFNSKKFERDDSGGVNETEPDIYFIVTNAQKVELLKTKVIKNVTGKSHDCPPYCTHKGMKQLLVIDYVTVAINKIGPVQTKDIDTTGLASFNNVDERPFRGKLTISGRVWGDKAKEWELYYAKGVVADKCITGLKSSGEVPKEVKEIAHDTYKVWDGPIYKWDTAGLEGLYTIILVVRDDKGNGFHDTQIVHLHNAAIDPPAQISFPASGATVSRAQGTSIQIKGTANDDHFYSYGLSWIGDGNKGQKSEWITYPASGNEKSVVNGILGTWDIGKLKNGPYALGVSVLDRTISDTVTHRSDVTWTTLNIAD